MLIPPALVKERLFDEEFFFYGEDIELGWRLTALGIDQVPVAKAMVNHEGSASSRNGSMFYEYHINRGHWLLARKTSKNRGEYIAALAARLIILPFRSIIRSVRFASLVPIRALWMATFDVACGRRQTLTPPAYMK
jgi:GT2 family glycosyltransferase